MQRAEYRPEACQLNEAIRRHTKDPYYTSTAWAPELICQKRRRSSCRPRPQQRKPILHADLTSPSQRIATSRPRTVSLQTVHISNHRLPAHSHTHRAQVFPVRSQPGRWAERGKQVRQVERVADINSILRLYKVGVSSEGAGDGNQISTRVGASNMPARPILERIVHFCGRSKLHATLTLHAKRSQ